ncbi:LytTR family DNA-binding domain-containing protein [Chryseobacterium sp.]|mgnify:CR=1 FL=1|uniref:LytR/AlgR family response regulator transcription factor n=1 Tax=Chryseobacterium sp. TaxID=1871047 RepID=UPI0025C0D768|nr:LytTR family DNA-binding domain-containing protein [Chryseobacterium sp.]
MRILIIEDESAAVDTLKQILYHIDPAITILKDIPTIKSATEYLKNNTDIDLIFLDINLADGNSFDIFKSVKVDIPIIFTTAYSEYALEAFKVHSIDYLLKPIRESEVRQALQKKESMLSKKQVIDYQILSELINGKENKYKNTFLLYVKDKMIPVQTENIAYFYLENGILKILTLKEKQLYILSNTLEEIAQLIDPALFFRINRHMIISRKCIEYAETYFSGRILLKITPCHTQEKITVSKVRVSEFKQWLETR